MRRTWLVLLAGLALLLGGAAWLLRGGGAADGESGVLRAQRAADEARVLPAVAGADDAAPEAIDEIGGAGVTPPSDASPDAAPANPPPTWAFTGRVTDDAGLPLEGATVVYWPNEASGDFYGFLHSVWSSAEERAGLPHALTNRDGRFELHASFRSETNPWGNDEDPQLVVVADGYAIRSRVCSSYVGGDLDAGDIALEPGAFLEGRIVDARGGPVAGAVIKPWNPRARSLRGIVDERESFSELSGVFAAATSADDGRFRCSGLWEGKVQVGVSADGFLDVWREYVDVHVGQPTDLGDIVLDAGSVLVGLVRDTSGAPVAGARVLAVSSDDYRLSQSRNSPDRFPALLYGLREEEGERTDAQGRFVVPRLPAVNHSLFVDADGYEPGCLDDLLPGGPDLVVELVRAATLRLTVTDNVSGQPLAGAEVRARRYVKSRMGGSGVDVPVTAGEAPGQWLVARLGLTCTQLRISAPGHATRMTDIEGARPPAQLERTVALVPESVLAGRIVGENGVALQDIEVQVSHADPKQDDQEHVETTDAQGRYEVRGLAAGEWMLTADGPEQSPIQRRETLAEGEQRQDIDFVLPRSAQVFGVCYSDDGTPEAGVRKTFVPAESVRGVEHRTVRAAASGAYELLDMPIGSWMVHGNPTREFTLAAGERLQLDLREDPEAAIEGRVLRADGSPVPGAWVFLQSEVVPGTRVGIPAHADEHGHWQWKPAYKGTVNLVAMVTGGGGTSETKTVELRDGERRSIDLYLGSGRVTGRVVEAGEKPVASVVVRLQPLAGEERITWGNMSVGGEAFEFGTATDADGYFALAGVGAGRYRVDVDAPGLRLDEQPPLELAAGAEADVLLTVQRTGSIRGRAELASGVPIPEGGLVSAASASADRERHTRIEAGAFEFEGLQAGEWRVWIADGARTLVERAVTVEAGQAAEVTLIVPP